MAVKSLARASKSAIQAGIVTTKPSLAVRGACVATTKAPLSFGIENIINTMCRPGLGITNNITTMPPLTAGGAIVVIIS